MFAPTGRRAVLPAVVAALAVTVLVPAAAADPVRPAGVNGAGMSPNSTVAPATNLANEQTAFTYFVNKGLTETQAAGVIGNLDQESGMDPTIRQGGGGPGRGIAQWSAGGRWDHDANDNVVWYANRGSQSPTTLPLQLQFVWYELTTFPGYGMAALRAATTITAAVSAFEQHYEGCGSCDTAARVAYAQQAFSRYAVQVEPGASAIWSDSTYHVIWTSNDGSLMHTWSTSSSWQSENLAGLFSGAPSAVYRPGRLDVFAVSASGHLYQRSSQNNTWSAWTMLANTNGWQPGVTAVWNGIDYQLFGHNAAGHLLMYAGAGTQWNLTDLGAVTSGTPAVTYHDGRYDVFAVASNSRWLYRISMIGTTWTTWHAVDSVNKYSLVGASAVWDGANYHVYAATQPGRLCQMTFTTKWVGPQVLTGQLTGSPGSTTYSSSFDVFAPNSGGIYRVSYTPSSRWQPALRIV